MKRCSEFKRGAWSEEEDDRLRKCIEEHGEGQWHQVAQRAGLNRCRKSCRLRWLNYLKPDIKRGEFKDDEVDLIIRLHNLLGNRWSMIAGRLPGRTSNDIKNYWNTHIRKKVVSADGVMGAVAHQRKKVVSDQTNKARMRTGEGASSMIIRPQVRSLPKRLLSWKMRRVTNITDDIRLEDDLNKPSLTQQPQENSAWQLLAAGSDESCLKPDQEIEWATKLADPSLDLDENCLGDFSIEEGDLWDILDSV